jgi:sigma-E factor negative regulatory protein RseC
MIVETGTVVEVKNPQIAMIRCQKNSACEHCPSINSCHTEQDGRAMIVEAYNPLAAEVGDQVKVETSTRHFLQSSFVLYIIPVLGLVIGALAGQLIGEHTDVALDPALLSALMGVAFMVGTFLVIRVGTRALPRELFMPKIVEIIQHSRHSEKDENHGH